MEEGEGKEKGINGSKNVFPVQKFFRFTNRRHIIAVPVLKLGILFWLTLKAQSLKKLEGCIIAV